MEKAVREAIDAFGEILKEKGYRDGFMVNHGLVGEYQRSFSDFIGRYPGVERGRLELPFHFAVFLEKDGKTAIAMNPALEGGRLDVRHVRVVTSDRKRNLGSMIALPVSGAGEIPKIEDAILLGNLVRGEENKTDAETEGYARLKEASAGKDEKEFCLLAIMEFQGILNAKGYGGVFTIENDHVGVISDSILAYSLVSGEGLRTTLENGFGFSREIDPKLPGIDRDFLFGNAAMVNGRIEVTEMTLARITEEETLYKVVALTNLNSLRLPDAASIGKILDCVPEMGRKISLTNYEQEMQAGEVPAKENKMGKHSEDKGQPIKKKNGRSRGI